MASTSLTRTFTAGNRKTFTISTWFKLATPTIPSSDFENIIAASGSDHGIWIRDDNKLDTYFITNLVSTNILRDTSGWYHVVAEVDTTQATDSNRVKIYLNGEQVSLTDSSGGSAVYPTQNADTQFNDNGGTCSIGKRGSTDIHYWNGSMAHFHFIDGTAYDADTFGETDSTTGIWKPKFAPSVTYGTNGFFLKFENSAAFGTDSSGNSNTFTVNGTMTQNIDTPSNVFATLNPLQWNGNITNASLSNGNTTYTSSATGTDYSWFYSTLGATSGKWYAEFKCVNSGGAIIGIGGNDFATSSYFTSNAVNSDGIGYYYNGTVFIKDVSQGSLTAISNNDIVGVAMDLDNSLVYWYLNGSVQNSGTGMSIPTSNTGFYHFVVGDASSTPTPTIQSNFGNGYFGTTAVSSAQNPDDGIGIFEYDVPAGYRALNTKSINAEEYS